MQDAGHLTALNPGGFDEDVGVSMTMRKEGDRDHQATEAAPATSAGSPPVASSPLSVGAVSQSLKTFIPFSVSLDHLPSAAAQQQHHQQQENYLSSDSAHTTENEDSEGSSRASSNRDDGERGYEEREIGTQTSLNSKALRGMAQDEEGRPAFGEGDDPPGAPNFQGGDHVDPAELAEDAVRDRAVRNRVASSSFSSDRSGTETSGGDSEDYYVDNPTPQIIPPPVETGAVGEKHVIVMVGLPARGKTHMARR